MAFQRALKNNGLTIVMFSIFVVALIGMSIAGWRVANNELQSHAQPTQSYGQYVMSGDFVEAVFENWESEFLQMWALVVLTIFLKQKGSADSKPLRGTSPVETASRLSILRAPTWKQRGNALKHTLYAHSLSIALLSIFVVSFMLHAFGGVNAYNEEAMRHKEETVSVIGYMGSSQFWFESLQNWQSEFLAVGTLVILSVYLRERGSQQSKPVGHRYDHTTGE